MLMPVKMTRSALLLYAALALVAGAQPAAQVTGTFSNVQYHEKSGDVTGLEIRIVAVAGNRLQAMVQLFEGEPSEVRVVEVRRNGLNVSFSMPDLWSDQEATFRGTVTRAKLTGMISYATGTKERLELKRAKSYWD